MNPYAWRAVILRFGQPFLGEFLSQLVGFPNAASTCTVDSALVGSGQNCLLP